MRSGADDIHAIADDLGFLVAGDAGKGGVGVLNIAIGIGHDHGFAGVVVDEGRALQGHLGPFQRVPVGLEFPEQLFGADGGLVQRERQRAQFVVGKAVRADGVIAVGQRGAQTSQGLSGTQDAAQDDHSGHHQQQDVDREQAVDHVQGVALREAGLFDHAVKQDVLQQGLDDEQIADGQQAGQDETEDGLAP